MVYSAEKSTVQLHTHTHICYLKFVITDLNGDLLPPFALDIRKDLFTYI